MVVLILLDLLTDNRAAAGIVALIGSVLTFFLLISERGSTHLAVQCGDRFRFLPLLLPRC